MSATAPRPDARPVEEWHGEDVEIDDVADRLLRMSRDHAHRAHGHAATRTLTLLVAPGPDVAPTLLADRLEETRTRHPARSVLLCEHEPDRLDASLRIECAVGTGPGTTGFCHDAIVLRAPAPRLRHADSLMHALLIAGLPTVLWLPGAQPSAAEPPLAAIADAIVLDSGGARDVAAAFARATRLGEQALVRDLAWLALARGRQRVAAAFDPPAGRALLARADRLEVRCGGPAAAIPLLLAGWIIARAGWRLARLAPAADDGHAWHARAQRPDGGDVALEIGRPTTRGDDAPRVPDGVHALAFHAGAETLEIVEPVAEPDAARAFATALRTFDEAASGYAPALAALQEGLARQ